MDTCNSRRLILSGALLLFTICARAESVYQSPEEFIAGVFGNGSPETKVLWVTADLRDAARSILNHDLPGLRLRYWQTGARSAWILDEVGKDKPITTGIVVNNGAIEVVKVLVFRESRGWEVRYPFFTDQFIGAKAQKNQQLDRNIDGISGATLSVHALTRQTRLALLLARHAFSASGAASK